MTAAHCTMYITQVSLTKTREKKVKKRNLPQDKERLKELNQQCVEKGYYNAKFKMKMKCKYIETSGGRLKNLEITTEPKGAVWAGVMDLHSGKYSQSLKLYVRVVGWVV